MTRRFFAAVIAALALTASTQMVSAQQGSSLTTESLGGMLTSMGVKPELDQTRYDFKFKAKINQEEWNLSMSTVLSQDGESLWLMAWLDPLPKSAKEVPVSGLLRMLAENDKLGGGKFFAFVPGNRRFVLQRVVPNQNIDATAFRSMLKDLSLTVVDTYPTWAVVNWNSGGAENAAQPAQTASEGAGVYDSTIRR